jgi:hypothetical protein
MAFKIFSLDAHGLIRIRVHIKSPQLHCVHFCTAYDGLHNLSCGRFPVRTYGSLFWPLEFQIGITHTGTTKGIHIEVY